MKTAAVLRSEAKALGLTLEGNARLKATKIAWEAQIAEALASGVATPQKATTYITKEQAIAAAATKGYAIEIDSENFEVRIKNQDVIVTTVWLVSDVVRWCKTAPSVVVVAKPEPTLKEQVTNFISRVEETLNPRFYKVTNIDSFALTLDIFYLPEKQVIGRVSASRMNETASYRLSTDARSVTRPASSVAIAVEIVTEHHLASLKSCFA